MKEKFVRPEIEKGIPIPKKRTYWKYPWPSMEVGDSFWVKKSRRAIGNAAADYVRLTKLDWKFTTAVEARDGVEGARCWRIK